mmetsp:Transcript_63910/g.101641  ORF Transcript_63910/g.101641 Transcript_63910/m.101641 type:complete len:175 (+) Transcript_63910:21-545(+)
MVRWAMNASNGRGEGAQIPLRDIMSRRELKTKVLCKYWAEQTCARGDKCRFSHDLIVPAPGRHAPQPQVRVDAVPDQPVKFSQPAPPPTRLAQAERRSPEKEGVRTYDSYGAPRPSTGGDEGRNPSSASSQFPKTHLEPSTVRQQVPARQQENLSANRSATSSTTPGYIVRFVL